MKNKIATKARRHKGAQRALYKKSLVYLGVLVAIFIFVN
ncbi:MAG: hypothetical protein QG657_4371, partial [Acidobacteriota bacterium]|nr:hypothetical protein [Acidobacteriota bacterium]